MDAMRVYVSGKYAYVSSYDYDMFYCIDVSNPASPRIVGNITDTARLNEANGIFVSGQYAYCTGRYSLKLAVIKIPGINAPAASIGDLAASSIEVSENVDVGNNLYVRSGINVGQGGLKSDGPVSIMGAGTSTLSALDVRDASGNSRLTVLDNGNVGIGTTLPKARLEIVPSNSTNGFYLNIANAKLVMKSPNGSCWACGANNTNVWNCTSMTCP
jgi:hypothetical protein